MHALMLGYGENKIRHGDLFIVVTRKGTATFRELEKSQMRVKALQVNLTRRCAHWINICR